MVADQGASSTTVVLDERQLIDITNAIIALGVLDFSVPLAVRGDGPLDAVTAGLEALREELQAKVVSKGAAQVAQRAKAEFLAAMSHELRTPLATVVGCADLLKNTELNTVQQELVWHIERSINTLNNQIRSVLDYAAVSSGQLQLASLPFSLPEVLGDMVRSHRTLAEQRGVSLELDLEGVTADPVMGDAERLAQILQVLLSNAIKFTDQGSVCVKASSLVDGECHRLRLEVKDTGRGIPGPDQHRIFERFVRLDSPTTAQHRGVGLGLCLSRAFTELMGGEIGVQSEVGRGALFWIEVPLPFGVESSEGKTTQPASPEETLCAHVLVVDDHHEICQVTAEMLRHFGCTVEVATSGEEAIEFLSAREFDLVLMDWHMPGMGGHETARKARSFLVDRTPPIVACSAHLVGAENLIQDEGCMVAQLVKPFRMTELREVVSRWTTSKSDDVQ